MKTLTGLIGISLALGLVITDVAQARDRHHHRGDDLALGLIVGGIAGAALSDPGYNRYDRGYYGGYRGDYNCRYVYQKCYRFYDRYGYLHQRCRNYCRW